jgi:hypothetical protein
MSTPPPIPKTHPNKGRPPKITLEILYDYMESIEEKREERDAKIQIELETLEKRSEERDLKVQIKLEAMFDKKIILFKDTIQSQIDDRFLGFKSELQTMKDEIQEMEKHKQSTQEGGVEGNHNLRDRIKELEEKLTNNLTLSNMENKLDIKPIKEEMNKLIKLDHERNKRALNLIIFDIKEQQEEDTLAIVKEELKNKSQIDTTYLIEAKRLGKIIDHKDRLIRVKVSCNDYKYSILSKYPSLKGSRIFMNEDLIREDQAELRKEVQKVKEARKEGKWAIIRNQKAIVRDRDQKDNNK